MNNENAAQDVGQTLRPRRYRIAAATGGCALLAAGLAFCVFASGCQQSEAPAATRQVVATAGGSTGAATGAAAVVAKRPMPLRDITFDTVKLKMNKEEPFRKDLITPAIERLSDNKVRIRGYILPPFQQTGLTRFVLVRDNMACCFGPGAAIYDSMIVDMQPGKTIDYKLQPIVVEGTFNVREVRSPSGRYMSIYHLTADKAE
jgi:hypothetical protein